MHRLGRLTILFGFSLLSFSCGGKTDQTEEQKEPVEESMSADIEPGAERPLAAVEPSARLNYYSSLPPMVIDENKKYTAVIRTNKGDVVVELDAVAAPLHTNSFVFLARQGFYDGLTFHRYVPNFVIQGGDPTGTGTGGPGYTIPAEFALPHHQGVIAMARRGDNINPQKESSGSQFYITLTPQPNLDQMGYSVFGRVTEGFDVVQQLREGDLITRIDIEEN